jgi:chemotaxis signal transduction protein
MSEAGAWLLDLGGGLFGAVGEREMVHVLPDRPVLQEIPQSPGYCRKVLVWQGEVLPLMDLAGRLAARPRVSEGRPELIAVTAFQQQPGAAPRHGALVLNAPPVRVRVHDAQACELPEPQRRWQRLSIACFQHPDHGPVPVLDLPRVFLLPPDDEG